MWEIWNYLEYLVANFPYQFFSVFNVSLTDTNSSDMKMMFGSNQCITYLNCWIALKNSSPTERKTVDILNNTCGPIFAKRNKKLAIREFWKHWSNNGHYWWIWMVGCPYCCTSNSCILRHKHRGTKNFHAFFAEILLFFLKTIEDLRINCSFEVLSGKDWRNQVPISMKFWKIKNKICEFWRLFSQNWQ